MNNCWEFVDNRNNRSKRNWSERHDKELLIWLSIYILSIELFFSYTCDWIILFFYFNLIEKCSFINSNLLKMIIIKTDVYFNRTFSFFSIKHPSIGYRLFVTSTILGDFSSCSLKLIPFKILLLSKTERKFFRKLKKIFLTSPSRVEDSDICFFLQRS